MDEQEKVDRDEQRAERLKDFCQDRALKKMAEMADFLESVALDKSLKDKKVISSAAGVREVEVSIPVNVRVASAKLWKELVADKAVGDIKEKAKEKPQRGINIKNVLSKLAEEMESGPKEEGEL